MLEQSGVEGGTSAYLSFFSNGGQSYKIEEIISGLAWGLGYCGMPHILVRFMAVRNEKELNKSKGVAIIWVLISLVMACMIGIVGRAYLSPALTGSDTEKVFINMIIAIFTNEFSLAIIAGIFLCGILAAIMSTADSQLLVTASSMAEDIYKGIVKRDATEKTVFRISRITVVVVALIAYLIALNPNSSIMGLVSNAWAGLGAAFGPTVLMSLYWKRIIVPGAVSGIASGALAVIIWDYIPLVKGETLGTVTGIYSLAIGFFIGLLVIVVVSLLTAAPSKEMLEEFEDVSKKRIDFDSVSSGK
jgi:sodium/proline symporter